MRQGSSESDWAAVVLAGGRGSRLGGVHKPALETAGGTLLDRALDAVHGADPIVVVGPELPTAVPVRWTREQPPWGGPVAALAAGLREVPTRLVAVLAGDLAGVHRGTVDRLRAALRSDVDGAVLVDASGRPQWLLGFWHVPALRAALPADPAGAALRRVLGGLALVELPAQDGEEQDVDTPRDLDRLR